MITILIKQLMRTVNTQRVYPQNSLPKSVFARPIRRIPLDGEFKNQVLIISDIVLDSIFSDVDMLMIKWRKKSFLRFSRNFFLLNSFSSIFQIFILSIKKLICLQLIFKHPLLSIIKMVGDRPKTRFNTKTCLINLIPKMIN